jgi:hypothetical protein
LLGFFTNFNHFDIMKIVVLGYNEYLILEDSGEAEMAKLTCSMWNNKAELFTQEAHYLIKSTGFWGMTMELSLQEQRLYKMNMTWRGHYEIRSLIAETNQFFTFKAKSLTYKHFVLLDSQTNELLNITVENQIFGETKINLSAPNIEKVQSLANDNLLIYLSLYCTNRLLMMMYAGS